MKERKKQLIDLFDKDPAVEEDTCRKFVVTSVS